MIVMKFGGTSVGTAEAIKKAASLIQKSLSKRPIVVVSAAAGITDLLIKAAKEAVKGSTVESYINELQKRHYDIIKNLGLEHILIRDLMEECLQLIRRIANYRIASEEALDKVQSYGERFSSRIVAAYLQKIGVEAAAYDAWDIGMITNPSFGDAEPLDDTPQKIVASLKKFKIPLKKVNVVPVITGFIGKTSSGEITTLGRGGSDYTAAIIGAAVNAKEIQIWTDVDGIMTADPEVVKKAKTIEKISFAEASELAYFGAKVLHPKTILPAMKKNIPVRVLDTFAPKGKGTLILRKVGKTKDIIKAIACKKNISLVHINSTRMLEAHGFLARVFDVFAQRGKSVDVVSTSEVSVSLTIDDEEDMKGILDELKNIAETRMEKGKAILCVVGGGMRHVPGVAGRTFTALGKNKINIEMISQGASEINITLIVDGKDADRAVNVLHEEYFG